MLVVVAIFVIALLTLAIIEPKDVVVTRSVLIKAPKEAVFEQMSHFKNWPNWSPWNRMDSSMKMTYYGTDGQPGSGYKWDGSKKTGAGEMRNTAVDGTQMDFDITYTEPYTDEAKSMLKATDSAGSTRATWTITMHKPFPLNAMNAFIDLDKLLGGDLLDGLNNIKTFIEGKSAPAPVAAAVPVEGISEVQYAGGTFIGVRQVVKWSEMDRFTNANRVMLTQGAAAKINGKIAGLYYTWDTVSQTSDMAVVFPVTDTMLKVKGAAYITVAPAKAVMAVQKGSYSKSMETHGAIEKYMVARGEKYSLVIEDYEVGPPQEPDSNKWVTNVYYLLK
ncbi:MAG: Polyketide cyclase / dehydrase and lipid transport [Flavipsychrobacter sp.]|nr:Polyketide cyclase / dehydrase and lipid transport [Flavipsychrobacter sp.]